MVTAITTEDGREISRTTYESIDEALAVRATMRYWGGEKIWEQVGTTTLVAQPTKTNKAMVCELVEE